MFDDFEGDRKVEGAVAERERGAVGLDEGRLGVSVLTPRPRNGLGRLVDAARGFGSLGEQSRAVSGPAAGVKNTAPARQRFREAVAGEMFVEQVRLSLSGDDALASKLHHSVGLRAMIA